jgi:hypothetical protein
MNYKEFFTTDNKSGWKTKELILMSKKPEIYSELKLFINQHKLFDLSFKEQIWYFINNYKERKVCLNCSNLVTFKDSLNRGYNDFCSLDCANNSNLLKDRAIKATKNKFGVDYFTQHDTFLTKVKKTKLEKYGDENYNNITQCLKTKEKLYGNKNYNNKQVSIITTRENLLLKLSSVTSDKLIKYDIGDANITLNCSYCKNNYEVYNTLFNYRSENNIKICTLCNPISSTNSFHQKELSEFITELLPLMHIKLEDKIVINPLELDIYIPDYRLAIEFNGLYWHSNKYVNNNYHLNKTNLCNQLGIELIHIFEDEWIYKKDIVKSIIKSKFGLATNKIFARKCFIKVINTPEARIFLDTNHIQGYTNSKINLGLYYNDELVSLLTLGPHRKVLGGKSSNNNYELLRFANKLESNVIGGFSKLLKHFIKIYIPDSILTYSDNRYFTGNIYKNFGFEFISETKPNYAYILKHKREHRFKYRKDRLIAEGYDIDKSEAKIMSERGINKIYDCGNKKWLLNIVKEINCNNTYQHHSNPD